MVSFHLESLGRSSDVPASGDIRLIARLDRPDGSAVERTETIASVTSLWTKKVRKLNEYLRFVDEQGKGIKFHSQMLRDTYAVEMLLQGVTLEDVSKLLPHQSVRITEKYYAPWIKARQELLESRAIDAMRRMGVTVTVQ